MTSVQAEIDAKILYVALKALSAVVDEANLCFTHDGLSVRQLDMAEVSMVDLFVPRGIFESYDVEQEKHVAAIRISDVLKLFKRPKKGDRVAISHRGENMLALALRGDKNFTFKVPVLPGDGKELPLPKVSFTEAFTARTKAIGDFLDGARQVTDSVCFDVTQNGATVNLVAKGEVSDISQQLTTDDGSLVDCDLRDTVKASYDLNRLLKFFQKDLGETAFLEFARDLPMKITYSLSAGDLFRERGQVVYWVAPKVERDSPPPKKEEPIECDSCGLKFESVTVEEVDGKAMDLCDKCLEQVKQGKRPWREKLEQMVQASKEAQEEPKEEQTTPEVATEEEPYVCEVCGAEIPDGEETRLEDGETIVCAQHKPEEPVATTTLPSELEQAKEIVKEVLGPAEPKPEPVQVVAMDPLEAFRKKFAKKP